MLTYIFKAIITIIISICFFYFFITHIVLEKVIDATITVKNNSVTYFDDFNISFSGHVVSKKLISGDVGLIKVALIESVDTLYDIREQNTMYFCVLTDSFAEIITRHFQISVGDSFVFNGLNDSIYIYREDILEESWQAHINNNVDIFNRIRRKHDL